MVVVVGDVTGGVVGDLTGRMGEGIPDGRQASVFGDGALDLTGRGCGPPEEARRERPRRRLRARRWLGGVCRLRDEGNAGGAECGGARELGEGSAGELV